MQAIDLTLRLDAAGDSLTGTAENGSGETRDFSGWLGLISALESLMQTDSQTTPSGGSR